MHILKSTGVAESEIVRLCRCSDGHGWGAQVWLFESLQFIPNR